LTDGSTDLHGVTKITAVNAVVGGSSAAATLTVPPGSGYGTLAGRPSAGVSGRLYYATDTSLVYRDNGSSWDTLYWDASAIYTGQVATARGGLGIDTSGSGKGDVLVNSGSGWVRLPVGANGLVLVADSTAADGVKWSGVPGGWTQLYQAVIGGGSFSAFSFTSIPATYTDLILCGTVRTTYSGAAEALYMQLNGDTSTAYDSNLAGANAHEWYIGNATSAGAGAGRWASFQVTLPNYANTSFFKNGIFEEVDDPSSSPNARYTGGTWLNTAAINRVDVLLLITVFAAGSICTVYGR
jgi:hypothetical protein